MKLNQEDKKLIEMATDVLKANSDIYSTPEMHVACVVKAKSGKVYKGINLKTSHSVCAEQVAIGQAFACGEREIDTIVTVKLDANGVPNICSPCGLCRYIINKFGLKAKVIVENEQDEVLKVYSDELLPYPYRR